MTQTTMGLYVTPSCKRRKDIIASQLVTRDSLNAIANCIHRLYIYMHTLQLKCSQTGFSAYNYIYDKIEVKLRKGYHYHRPTQNNYLFKFFQPSAELQRIVVVQLHSRIFQHGAYTFRTREGAKHMRIARKRLLFSLCLKFLLNLYGLFHISTASWASTWLKSISINNNNIN